TGMLRRSPSTSRWAPWRRTSGPPTGSTVSNSPRWAPEEAPDMPHAFSQVDVFSAEPLLGNPVAVVHAADDLTAEQMAAFARWTNLSETTFLLRPTSEAADYRLRIFTPGGELPFAGHPTLGSAHAWLEAGCTPRTPG